MKTTSHIKAAALAVTSALVLSGCSTPAAAPAAPAQTAPTEQTPAAPAAPAADAPFAVTIDGSSKIKDYEGKPALVVDFTFTNNDDEAASFMVSVSDKAFQNGVELDRAIAMDTDAYDAGPSMKEIKPGATVQVQSAYLLVDDSDVTVEVTELFSFSDAMLATTVISVK